MRVAKHKSILNHKLEARAHCKDVAVGVTFSADGPMVRSSGNHSKVQDAMNRYVDMEAEVYEAVVRLADVMRDVTGTIEKLKSPTEYDIVHKKHIQHMSFWEIAESYGRGYSWATTTYSRALAHVQAILEEQNAGAVYGNCAELTQADQSTETK